MAPPNHRRVGTIISSTIQKEPAWALTLISSACTCCKSNWLPPVFDRAFIETKGLDDRLQGTALGQECKHEHHRYRIGPQTVEDRAFAGREGLPTGMADVALFRFMVHTDVSFVGLSSCRTVRIQAK